MFLNIFILILSIETITEGKTKTWTKPDYDGMPPWPKGGKVGKVYPPQGPDGCIDKTPKRMRWLLRSLDFCVVR